MTLWDIVGKVTFADERVEVESVRTGERDRVPIRADPVLGAVGVRKIDDSVGRTLHLTADLFQWKIRKSTIEDMPLCLTS